MYGTVAKLRFKQGMEAEMLELREAMAKRTPVGAVATIVYKSDAEPLVWYLAHVAESQESYVANANSPEQHAQYQQMRALLEEDPEWNDGEVLHFWQGQ
ncbi:MAG: hypothetical protein ACRC1H_04150 [Caldilineaceae bacterium]